MVFDGLHAGPHCSAFLAHVASDLDSRILHASPKQEPDTWT